MRDGNKGFEGREPGHTRSGHSVHGHGSAGKTTLTSRLSPGASPAAVQLKSNATSPVASAAGSEQGTSEDWTRVVFRPDLHSTPVQRKSNQSGTEAAASPADTTTHQQ